MYGGALTLCGMRRLAHARVIDDAVNIWLPLRGKKGGDEVLHSVGVHGPYDMRMWA